MTTASFAATAAPRTDFRRFAPFGVVYGVRAGMASR